MPYRAFCGLTGICLEVSHMKIMKMLEGRKTFIVSGLVAVATIAQMFEVITASQFEAILGLLAAFGLYSVRDAIRKL